MTKYLRAAAYGVGGKVYFDSRFQRCQLTLVMTEWDVMVARGWRGRAAHFRVAE